MGVAGKHLSYPTPLIELASNAPGQHWLNAQALDFLPAEQENWMELLAPAVDLAHMPSPGTFA